METVTVEINKKWVSRINSPYYKFIIGPLTGVAITFAPLFLYWAAGSEITILRQKEWFIVPLCFAIIYLIPMFYIWLGGSVIKQLYKR